MAAARRAEGKLSSQTSVRPNKAAPSSGSPACPTTPERCTSITWPGFAVPLIARSSCDRDAGAVPGCS